MKVISTKKAQLHTDREGKVEEFVQIEIFQGGKDDVNKMYTFHTVDMMVLNFGEKNEELQPVINRYGQPQSKSYTKSYEEYDGQKQILSELYPSDLKGSELDDYYLLMGLLYNLQIEPIYGVEFVPR